MSKPILILVAVVFVGLVAGLGEGIGRHGINPFTIAVVAIILGSLTSIVKTLSKTQVAEVPETDQRLSELEKRITDMQDIIISIDDRLQRLNSGTTKQTDATSD
jgi:hypothetical protein